METQQKAAHSEAPGGGHATNAHGKITKLGLSLPQTKHQTPRRKPGESASAKGDHGENDFTGGRCIGNDKTGPLPRKGTQRTEGEEGAWRDSPDTPCAHTYGCNKPMEASQNGHRRSVCVEGWGGGSLNKPATKQRAGGRAIIENKRQHAPPPPSPPVDHPTHNTKRGQRGR